MSGKYESNKIENEGIRVRKSTFGGYGSNSPYKLSEYENDSLARAVGILQLKFGEYSKVTDYQTDWEAFLKRCKVYQNTKHGSVKNDHNFDLLVDHAQDAGRVRKLCAFRALVDIVQTLTSDERAEVKALAQITKWIDYLGRLSATHLMFQHYCQDHSQAGFSFHYKLLPSQTDDWVGRRYNQIVQSWVGNLELHELREVRTEKNEQKTESVQKIMDKVASSTNDDKARVHCEMQLLMHFLHAEEKCLDYFGCSKKSCWLCWQLIVQHRQFSMKGTHRKLYPRWAFPFSFSPSHLSVAQGLKTAYNEMLFLIQGKVIERKTLDNLDPIIQTSARLTPAHRRVINVEDVPRGPESGPFFENPITVRDRWPGVALPALHIPMNSSSRSLRQVSVHTYHRLGEDIAEQCMIDIGLGGKPTLLAFQLITKPQFECRDLGEDEVGRTFWINNNLLNRDTGRVEWIMYYRAGITTLDPNPQILSLWQRTHGHTYSSFPWRGDIFILNAHGNFPTELVSDMPDIDHKAVLQALTTIFANQGPNYAAIVEELDLKGLKVTLVGYKSKFNRRDFERDLRTKIYK